MARRISNPFPSVRTEGGLLPAETLQRIAAGEAGGERRPLDGLDAASYHLAPGERLNEAISRSWSRLVGTWASFSAAREKLPESDAGTTLTRERWLLPLFQELGYGRLPTTRPVPAGGRDYAVSHLWQTTPIHLVSFRVDLDRKAPGVSGASRSSPHSLVQELLNRSDEHLWGFVSNGLLLRLLRDNASLSRQAYVELDLAAMMEGELYSDFTLLWLLAHVSRVEREKPETPESCRLEAWTKAAREEGLRALDTLRDGVEEALGVLGRGFFDEPANAPLRDRLASGALPVQDYYRQLLRLVYRLLFLLVAEDRGLLFHPSSAPLARERYLRYFSLSRLRSLAASRRGSRHGDLWAGLVLVMKKLGSDVGCPELALPALGGFLFGDEAMPDLAAASLGNAALLEAVRKVALTERDGYLRPVDFRNLGAEELGSVYESLLELHPVLHAEGRGSFELRSAAGSERKTTGSYYTPTSLIECLLDSALDPVLDEAAKAPDPEKALLALKVCDPACGSGHFLIAAAHRIARRLASARTGEEEPDPSAARTALRDVIGRCLYGVDLNPMAAELCRVALWIEALEPGKPLSFLDHHVQVGNSLLGTTPALLAGGIPDEAFTPIEGDEKAACSAWKKQNKRERQQKGLAEAAAEPWEAVRHLAAERAGLDATPDVSRDGVRAKEERWRRLLASDDYARSRLVADAWCAAFVWKKTSDRNAPPPVTEETFRRLAANPASVPEPVRREVARLSDQYRFFHWHLAFPEVFRVPGPGEKAENEQQGWTGGFDVVLGNPPWEQQEFKETEWFASRQPDILSATTAAERKARIEALATKQPKDYGEYLSAKRLPQAVTHFEARSGAFPLCGAGRINTYAAFAEVLVRLLGGRARMGCIVPTGIATDDSTKRFFQFVVDTGRLQSIFDFENQSGLFPGVHREQRFSVLVIAGASLLFQKASYAFFLTQPEEIADRRFELGAADIAVLNPNTRTSPLFRSPRDCEVVTRIYGKNSILVSDATPESNTWPVAFRQGLFNMSTDSRLFIDAATLEGAGAIREGNAYSSDDKKYLPLYEGKLTTLWDHRAADFSQATLADVRAGRELPIPDCDHRDPARLTMPRFWVDEKDVEASAGEKSPFLLTFHGIANPNNERTSIFSITPFVGVGHSLFIVLGLPAQQALQFCAMGNSIPFDYVLRCKVASRNFSFFTAKQLPVISPERFDSCWGEFVVSRALELTYTAWDLWEFAAAFGLTASPFAWDPERRFLLRCELDAAFFHLYGIPRDDVAYILNTFPIVRRNDEKTHGEYRTKRVILEIYDDLQRAIDTGTPFVSSLDPAPGDPRAAHRS